MHARILLKTNDIKMFMKVLWHELSLNRKTKGCVFNKTIDFLNTGQSQKGNTNLPLHSLSTVSWIAYWITWWLLENHWRKADSRNCPCMFHLTIIHKPDNAELESANVVTATPKCYTKKRIIFSKKKKSIKVLRPVLELPPPSTKKINRKEEKWFQI